MNTQKWIIGISVIVSALMFIFSALLEWRVINNFLGMSLFIGHRAFIINCMLGVGASALVSFVVAVVSYKKEKDLIIERYFELLPYIYMDTDFFARTMLEYKNGEGMTIPRDKVEYFLEKLKSLSDLLGNAVSLGYRYSTIHSLNKIMFWRKDNFSISQKDFQQKCNSFYWDCKLCYEFMIRERLQSMDEDGKEIMRKNVQIYMNKISSNVDDKSDFEKIRKELFEEVLLYLKINKENEREG